MRSGDLAPVCIKAPDFGVGSSTIKIHHPAAPERFCVKHAHHRHQSEALSVEDCSRIYFAVFPKCRRSEHWDREGSASVQLRGLPVTEELSVRTFSPAIWSVWADLESSVASSIGPDNSFCVFHFNRNTPTGPPCISTGIAEARMHAMQQSLLIRDSLQ
jgi:hypothetical protein